MPDPAGVHTLAAPVAGWGPWGATSIVLAAGNELYAYDTATPAVPPRVLKLAKGGVGPAVAVSSLIAAPLTPGCPGAIDAFWAMATAVRF